MSTTNLRFFASKQSPFIFFLILLLPYVISINNVKVWKKFQDIESVFSIGKELIRQGNYQKAYKIYLDGLKQVEGNMDLEGQIKCLMNLGLVSWNLGKLTDSGDYYIKAKTLAQKTQNFNSENTCLIALRIIKLYREGKTYNNKRLFKKSIECYEKAIILAKEIGSKAHELKCLRLLSISYWYRSELERFLEINEMGLKIAHELNHKGEIASFLNNIGLYNSKKGLYSFSLLYYHDALKFARLSENSIKISNSLNNLANDYKYMGDYVRALDFLMEALKIDREIDNKDYIAIDLNNIAEILRRKALYSGNQNYLIDALTKLTECLSLARNNKDKITEIIALNNIGNIFIELNQYEYALNYLQTGFNEVKKIHNIETQGMLSNNLGNVQLNLGDYIKAEEYYKKAIEFGREIGASNILWEAHFGLGKTYERRSDFNKALECYKNASDVIDWVRSRIALDINKIGYARNKRKVYENMINLSYKLSRESLSKGLGDELFRVIEKSKARAFLDTLSEADIFIQSKLDAELKIEEKEITDKITSLLNALSKNSISSSQRKVIEEEIFKAEEDYNILLSRMRLENPALSNIVSSDPSNLNIIQRELLEKDVALIEYFLGEEQSYMLVISCDDCLVFQLSSSKEIFESVKAYLKFLTQSPNEEYNGKLAGHRLYKELLGPAIDGIPDTINSLIIVPDGVLYYLPFETLVVPDEKGIEDSDYLVSKYAVSYNPSASSLLMLSRESSVRERAKQLLAIGDPDYSNWSTKQNTKDTPAEVLLDLYQARGYDLGKIPYSKEEVKHVSKHFQENEYEIYLGKNASEHVIKTLDLEKYKVIHFACHSFLDESSPFRSALILSLNNNRKEDGFLHAREIYNLKFKAELIVLSACQTARGKLEYGEGVFGISRVFFYSGARSVVSTLWNIGDRSAVRFMDIFYGFLRKGYNKSQALQLTKLEMLNSKFSHPFYWAAFILNGEFRSVIF